MSEIQQSEVSNRKRERSESTLRDQTRNNTSYHSLRVHLDEGEPRDESGELDEGGQPLGHAHVRQADLAQELQLALGGQLRFANSLSESYRRITIPAVI